MKPADRPPIYSLAVEWLGWTLDRTGGLPRSQRFTFGERVDRLTLDCLEWIIEAIYSPPERKSVPLRRVNLNLEKLRVFWRLIGDRGWISRQQLLFAHGRLDEIGRMAGGWLKDTERRAGKSGP